MCPLRALLNNLHPWLDSHAQWLGRSVELWHGDVSQSERRRILRQRPDTLLTTPESLEAMLVSTKVDSRLLFSSLLPWSWTKCIRSLGTTAVGTYWPCWSG